MPTKTQEAEELVIRNGGGRRGVAAGADGSSRRGERLILAPGTPEVPQELVERQLAQMNAYVKSLEERTENYIAKSKELAKRGPTDEMTELAGPIGPVFPRYPWWNIYVVGPFQPLGTPSSGPYLPHKIIQPSLTFLWAVIWRNPAPIDWVFGNPSAAVLMNGTNYTLCCQMINLSTVTNGPDIAAFGAFSIGGFIDVHLLAFYPPTPPQGFPNLYELNVTVDTTEDSQPMAAFATWIYDLDTEPGFLFSPTAYPHFHHERPMRFLVYTP